MILICFLTCQQIELLSFLWICDTGLGLHCTRLWIFIYIFIFYIFIYIFIYMDSVLHKNKMKKKCLYMFLKEELF